MKNRFVIVALGVVACMTAFAVDYTWTGGAGDGKWTTPGNWGVASGYPSTDADYVMFNGDAEVTLDTGTITELSHMKISAGEVTLNATDGSVLSFRKNATTDASGIIVADGAKFNLNAPVKQEKKRLDKWGQGTLEISGSLTNDVTSYAWILATGTNVFSGDASVDMPNGNFYLGNGNSQRPAPVFVKDRARISTYGIVFSARDPSPDVELIQDGDATVVDVKENLWIQDNGVNDANRYVLKRGSLSATELIVEAQTPTNVHYVQEGGTSTFSKVSLKTGSAVLRGGRMNFLGSNRDFAIADGCFFGMEGGTLAWPTSFSPADFPRIKWSGTNSVALPEAESFTWDWSRSSVAEGMMFMYDNPHTLNFTRVKSTGGAGLVLGAGRTAQVDADSSVASPRGLTDPWKLVLNDGASFKLVNASSRLSMPLDITVNGSGNVEFAGSRGSVVAHRLVVDGEEKPKGIYWRDDCSFVEGKLPAAAIMVPHIWTGAGDGTSWNDPDNWDDGTVPMAEGDVADISRASSITLNEAIVLDGLIAMPNGAERKVTVTGSGSVTLRTVQAYSAVVLVPEGCELVFDVNVYRDKAAVIGFSGGGRFTVKKIFPGCAPSSISAYIAVDGTLAFAGSAATIQNMNNAGYAFLSVWSHEKGGSGNVLFEEGADFTCTRLTACANGYMVPNEFRQTGGRTTFDNFYLNAGNTTAGAPYYRLDGGEMTVNSTISLNRSLGASDTRRRYAGGSFEMTGGTLTCGGFNGACNQNYVRLSGGTVILKNHCNANFNPVWSNECAVTLAVTNKNEYTYYFGGVTVRPSSKTIAIDSGDVWLTGLNGDCMFDLSERGLNISTLKIAGPGGFAVTGGNTLSVTAECTFEGAVVADGGAVVFSEALNGPSSIKVTNPNAKVTLKAGSVKDLEYVELAAKACLAVSSGKILTVKRFSVGGVPVSAGTYTGEYGAGTVTVTAAIPETWLKDGAADLSYNASGASVSVSDASTLASLVYAPAGVSGQTNRITGAALTFADGANIHVEEGQTLVIGNDVILGGKVVKTGLGDILFNGAVSAPEEGVDGCRLTVTEGGASFDGAVTGVQLVTCGTKTVPVITLGENCTVSGFAAVLTAWGEDGSSEQVFGETVQNGASVDYSDGVVESLLFGKDQNLVHALARPNGGRGRWVLNGGTFESSADYTLSVFPTAGDAGYFEFVQNDGVLAFKKAVQFARNSGDIGIDYVLNGGRVEFHSYISGYAPQFESVVLNGGTVAFMKDGISFAPRHQFTLSISGDVTFETADPSWVTHLLNDFEGDASITLNGGEFKFMGAVAVNRLQVDAGNVTFGNPVAEASFGGLELVLSDQGSMTLDCGCMTVKSLKVGAKGRAAGLYSATQGPVAVRERLDGDGELLVLNSTAPGTVIMFR